MSKISVFINSGLANIRYFNRIKRNGGYLKIEGKYHLILKKNSSINLKANFCIGRNSFGANRQTIIRLGENSKLNIEGNATIFYDGDIIVFDNGVLTIGNSFINSGVKIRCHKHITIGDNCAISHDFTIMDSDVHFLNGTNNTKDTIIEDNVWIGTRVTILSGVKVGKGSVIAAGSIVTKDVPEKSLVGGNPAKVIKENITWRI